MKLLLTVAEAAEAMGTYRQRVYDLIHKGELPVVKVGSWKVPVVEVEKWILKNTEVQDDEFY